VEVVLRNATASAACSDW